MQAIVECLYLLAETTHQPAVVLCSRGVTILAWTGQDRTVVQILVRSYLSCCRINFPCEHKEFANVLSKL